MDRVMGVRMGVFAPFPSYNWDTKLRPCYDNNLFIAIFQLCDNPTLFSSASQTMSRGGWQCHLFRILPIQRNVLCTHTHIISSQKPSSPSSFVPSGLLPRSDLRKNRGSSYSSIISTSDIGWNSYLCTRTELDTQPQHPLPRVAPVRIVCHLSSRGTPAL